MELVKSEKKRDKLSHEGYLYVLDKKSLQDPTMCYWRCELVRKKNKCLARVHTKDGRIIKRLGTHSHEPNVHRVEVLRVVQEIKERALSTNEGTREIIATAQANLSPQVVALMPSTATICRAVQREKLSRKRAVQVLMSVPSSLRSQWNTQLEGSFGEQKEEEDSSAEAADGELQSSRWNEDLDLPPPKDDDSATGQDFSIEEWKDEDEMENNDSNLKPEEKPQMIQGPIVEIHTSRLTTCGLWSYKEASQRVDYVTLRSAFSDTVMGQWTAAGHGVNQVTQLIQYDSLDHMVRVQKDMEGSGEWREQWRPLEREIVSSDSVLTVLVPQTELHCRFEPSKKAVYELQILPEHNSPVVLGSEAILVGQFLSLYGPSQTEYRLLRYSTADCAFAAAYHSMQGEEGGRMVKTHDCQFQVT